MSSPSLSMNICLKSALDPTFHLPCEFNRIIGISLFTLDIVNLNICVLAEVSSIFKISESWNFKTQNFVCSFLTENV